MNREITILPNESVIVNVMFNLSHDEYMSLKSFKYSRLKLLEELVHDDCKWSVGSSGYNIQHIYKLVLAKMKCWV